jgi:hypothetical protein
MWFTLVLGSGANTDTATLVKIHLQVDGRQWLCIMD